MKSSRTSRSMKRRILAPLLAVVFLFAGMLAALAIVSDPVIRAKQAATTVTSSFTRDAADPQKITVALQAGFRPEAFRDIERGMRVVVSATDCVLLTSSGGSDSVYSWTNGNGTPVTETFTFSGSSLVSKAFAQTDFYSGAIAAADNARRFVAGTVYARVTGDNPSVSVTLEDTRYPARFPVTFVGYGQNYSIAQKSLGQDHWLYTISADINEIVGLIVNKNTHTIEYISGLGFNGVSAYACVIPGNRIPEIVNCLMNGATVSGWKTTVPTLAGLTALPSGTQEPLNPNDIVSLNNTIDLVKESGLNMLSTAAAAAYSWGPGNGYLQATPEALRNMCTVQRTTSVIRISSPSPAPATGDAAPIGALVLLCAASILGVAFLLRRRRGPSQS